MRRPTSTVSLMRLCAKSSMHRTFDTPWEEFWETPNLRVYGGRAPRPGVTKGPILPKAMSSRVWEKTFFSASMPSSVRGATERWRRRLPASLVAAPPSSSSGRVAVRTLAAGATGDTGMSPTNGKPWERSLQRSSASMWSISLRYRWMRATFKPPSLAALRTDRTEEPAPSTIFWSR